MTTLGDFGQLPLEIRKQIYGHVLVEDEDGVIEIERYVMRTAEDGIEPKMRKRAKQSKGTAHVVQKHHHRDPRHRGQMRDEHTGQWVPAPPSRVSILRASRAISIEAAQVLYGCNTFSFQDSAVLAGFLNSINDSKQHLRHVSIGNELLVKDSWASFDRIIAALTEVKGLRTLQVMEFHFVDLWHSSRRIDMSTFVGHCKPLLLSLQAAIESRNLNYGVLDVVKVKQRLYWHYGLDCGCDECCLLKKHSEDLVAEMHNEITEQLHLTRV